jgi:sugar phosphate isomerase/epimerase
MFHMHVRDSDSLVVHQLPIGQGLLDWHGIVTELAAVGFDGFLSIELGGYLNPARWLRESREYLVRALDEAVVRGGAGQR